MNFYEALEEAKSGKKVKPVNPYHTWYYKFFDSIDKSQALGRYSTEDIEYPYCGNTAIHYWMLDAEWEVVD